MAWSTPDLLDTPYEEYKKLSLSERLRLSGASLAEIGLGSPKQALLPVQVHGLRGHRLDCFDAFRWRW